jgi:hypothetical protein
MRAIGRLQRAMPRNPDLQLVCNELEARVMAEPPTGQTNGPPGKRDRREYQRDLMRRRREKHDQDVPSAPGRSDFSDDVEG